MDKLNRQEFTREDLAEERRQAIKRIENDLGDISEIQAGLSKIVNKQGDDINDISNMIEESVVLTTASVQNLQQAEHKSNRQRNTWIGIGVFAVTAVVLAAVVSRKD